MKKKHQNNKQLGTHVSRVEQHKKKKKLRPLLFILLPIMILVGGLVVYGGSIVQRAAEAIMNANHDLERGDRSHLREEDVQPLTDNVSVLIVGIDERADDDPLAATRADALLLATFNITDTTVNLVSIPRDTRTYLPLANRTSKINHAYAFDGIDGTVEAVEALFDIPVDFYIEFNFEAFMEIVDSLGGIEVDVPISFTEQDSRGRAGAITLEEGLQTLNGEEALALTRVRKIDSDIMRGQRQQLVIDAIASKALSLNSFSRMGDIIDAIDGNFRTNLTVNDMLAFYKYGTDVQINNLQIRGVDSNINNIYYYIPLEESIASIHETLYAHLNDLEIPNTDSDSIEGEDSIDTPIEDTQVTEGN